MARMERVAKKFRSFAEAEQAEKEYYLSLSPKERMDILADLIRQKYPDYASSRLERVYRIVKLHES